MIVAVAVVRMVEMPSDQVVNMVPMRNCLVAAPWAMSVFRLMLAAVMTWSAGRGILLADRNHVLCHSTAILLMAQLPFVEIIDVPLVLNLDVPAVRTVNVIACRW